MQTFHKNIRRILATMAILLTIGYTTAQNSKAKDLQAIQQKTDQWFQLWSPGDKPFTFEGIENVFADKEEGLLVVDGFEGSIVVLKSIHEYKDKWLPLVNTSFATYTIKPKDGIEIDVDATMATSTFIWVSENATLKDGTPVKLSQYATHVWKKINGDWKIVHEHLTKIDTSENESSNEEALSFEPQQLVITVPNVDESAQWYVDKLDFTMGKAFEVPEKGLTGRLVSKGDFELMFMKSENLQPLPESRKTSFTDLDVAGVKRIAFRVNEIETFAKKLRQRHVAFDVPLIPFEDPDTGVKFQWLIIKDNNGNLVEFMEY